MYTVIKIIVVVILTIVLPFIMAKINELNMNTRVQCIKCNHVYSAYENQFDSIRWFTGVYYKCPKCNQYTKTIRLNNYDSEDIDKINSN